jgi:hypothetical protein
MYRSSSVQRRSLAELTGGFNETERNFFPEAGKMLSRKFRDFAGAALALSRISLMPAYNRNLVFIVMVLRSYCHYDRKLRS